VIVPGYVYHVTHINTVDAIVRLGVNPKFSQGKRAVCWFVSRENIANAIVHVAYRHEWLLGQMSVMRCPVAAYQLQHTAWGGVYLSKLVIPVDAAFGVGDFLEWKNVRLS